MSAHVSVDPIVAVLELEGGAPRIRGGAEAFDYACSKARAEAIDRILLAVFEERGWSLFDESALDRVSVEHDGRTRARILVDGRPVTCWWQDRLETTAVDVTWRFEPAP